MAKVSLISCNTNLDPYPVYPLGMTMVAEAARLRGHDVSQWDLIVHGHNQADIRRFIQETQPDFVGLSLRNVDSANYNKPDAYFAEYKEVVEAIKSVSDAPIILGGSAYTIFPKEMLKELGADFGIAGEGEQAFCALLDQLEMDPDSAYPIYYNNTTMSGDNFACKIREPVLADYYLNKGGMLNVQTKRGCPHRCAYCSYPVLEGRRYRFRTPESVVDEIEMLVREYKADYYFVTDSVFNDAAGNYLKIARELVRRGIDVPWTCYLRPDNFTRDEAELLKRSGLSSVEWGTDCATDVTLKALRKDFTWDQVIHSNNLFAEMGIYNAHFIILGGPRETPATVVEGLKNLTTLQRCVIFAGIGVRIFPGTAVYDWAIQEGQISAETNLLSPTFYFSRDIDRDVLHQEILSAFAGRLDRIYPDGDYVDAARAYHEMGRRGPAWDMLLKMNISR
ncbi:radical SAM protein [candidate division KSB1 bacterium]|nr:cobalamin-dependent protein [candidate division KSB1 bacterium]RQV99797.1 MAG: radical SAM protein [candidate division KSB1 bacterium]